MNNLPDNQGFNENNQNAVGGNAGSTGNVSNMGNVGNPPHISSIMCHHTSSMVISRM